MTSSLEEIKVIDLEEWLTLATAPAPTKLKQGQSPDMQNVWIDEKPGSVITANGFLKVGQIPSGNPVTFCIDYFKTSAGTQIFVVSDNATVWTTTDFQTFTQIITGLSAAFQLRGAVIRDILWLTNGQDAVRTFDGSIVNVLDGSAIPTPFTIQNIQYTWNSTSGVGISPSAIMVNYTTGGTAGAEVVTVVGAIITVQIQSGVSTAQNIVNALNASPAALKLVSFSFSPGGSGGNTQTAPATGGPFIGGTPNVPRGRYISYHDERVWLYHVSSDRSIVYFSSLYDLAANIIDPTDPVAWDTTDNFLQISEGDADYGTGMVLYRGYLHFFKQYSIWRLVGFDEYTYSRVKTRASTGTRFNESVQILDSLVHLIGVDGIYVFDGEESVRISDIIDPATASQTAFGFNQLQQPNTNNQFWEVTSTADWNAGTVPTDLTVANSITLDAADDTQANFQAGATLTNIDTTTTPNSIQVSVSGSGHSGTNVALNAPATLTPIGGGTSTIGNPNQVTDGTFGGGTNQDVGFQGSGCQGNYGITFPLTETISRIILRQVNANSDTIIKVLGATIVASSPMGFSGNQIDYQPSVFGRTDITIDITPISASSITINVGCVNPVAGITVQEIQVFTTAYNASAQFVSKTLDLGITPASFGTFSATETLNSETTSYFTQSSADGVTWDAAVGCTNGGSIGSVPRRYLRWGVNITTDGVNTPVISAAFLPAVYLSAIHNTNGGIFSWGPFESAYSLAAQTINFYYRTATTSGGIPSASWNLIVPGGVINTPIANQFIQFKIEISGGNAAMLPSVTSVTINWVTGTAGQPQTLQNVASTYWRNRYWLSAAGPGATSNNTILIRGKKTFESPWMLKDWTILSFTRYFDSLYGGSSVDGSIYLLDTGYSKNGLAIDSHFETQDFTFGGFTAVLEEILVEAQRLGSWNLVIGYSVDGGNTFTNFNMPLTLSTYDSSYMKRFHVVKNNKTTRFRLRFSTDGVDQPFEVHRCIVFYRLEVERGSLQGDYN